MKSYTQFIKEVNTSVYGEVTVGSKPSTITKKSISSGIDKAIKNIGSGKGESTVAKKGGYGLSGGVNISMRGGSSQSPTKTKDPKPTTTKVKPGKTKDPKPTKVKPTTSTPSPSTNVLTKGSSTSSTSTSTQSPTKIRDPRTAKISDIRMGRM
tara:strand:- start:386 stop:844 length:459 start_codon:yes stop_codon:yes gene_type:complete